MKGTLVKMRTETGSPVRYQLVFADQIINLNDLLGHHLHLTPTGNIFCIQCGRKTKKSFQQGYCYPCLRRLMECNMCMLHPERCIHDENVCKGDDWAHANCSVPHVVYLANASGLKVGVTRESQVPTRWIDQGAIQAIPIFSTQNRYQAGILEVAFKKFVADKTNWRTMLCNLAPKLDLLEEKNKLLQSADVAIQKVLSQFPEGAIRSLSDDAVHEFFYPVMEYPQKIKVFNLDNQGTISGHLVGIKGQYLIFDQGVINIRKYGGYEVSLSEGCSGH